MARNLKNINHWIAELRELADKLNIQTDEDLPIASKDLYAMFSKSEFQVDFNDGLSPQEALNDWCRNWNQREWDRIEDF